MLNVAYGNKNVENCEIKVETLAKFPQGVRSLEDVKHTVVTTKFREITGAKTDCWCACHNPHNVCSCDCTPPSPTTLLKRKLLKSECFLCAHHQTEVREGAEQFYKDWEAQKTIPTLDLEGIDRIHTLDAHEIREIAQKLRDSEEARKQEKIEIEKYGYAKINS
jgi:hypothetical protein